MWELACVNRTWYLLRDGHIVLAAWRGAVYDGQHNELGFGNLREYAERLTKAPAEVPRMENGAARAHLEIHKFGAWLRTLEKPGHLKKPYIAPAEATVVESTPEPEPPVHVEPVKLPEPDERDVFKAIARAACYDAGLEVLELRNMLLVTGVDDKGGSCRALIRVDREVDSLDNVEAHNDQNAGLPQVARNRWFANKVRHLIKKEAALELTQSTIEDMVTLSSKRNAAIEALKR